MSWEELQNGARRTGRTTRMLQEAVRAANDGKTVIIIAADLAAKDRLTDRLHEMGDVPIGIRIEVPAVTLSKHDWAWPDLRLFNRVGKAVLPTNDMKVMVDHAAIEREFNTVLRELHRYDETNGEL